MDRLPARRGRADRRWRGAVRNCPVCAKEYGTAAYALACWLGHEPDLPVKNTLQQMGDRLRVSRERIRQVLAALGDPRRAHARRPLSASASGTAPAITLKPGERRPAGMTREQDPRRKARRKRRHAERMASDPAYVERQRAKRRRRAARQREQRSAQ